MEQSASPRSDRVDVAPVDERLVLPDPHADCKAFSQILDRIGDKWTIMTVGVLSGGPMRFSAIIREIGGVSHRMMTLTLRGLERDGLVTRTVYPTIPPRVEYELTLRGRSLIKPLQALGTWASVNRVAIEADREAYDRAVR